MENNNIISGYEKEAVKSKTTRKQYRKNLIKHIGNQILNISMEQNISLSELSTECRVPERFINWWINGKGKVYLDMLCKVCLKYNKKLIITIQDTDK